jgi:hypothetical protein
VLIIGDFNLIYRD